MLVCNSTLTQLIIQEDFSTCICHDSFKSYVTISSLLLGVGCLNCETQMLVTHSQKNFKKKSGLIKGRTISLYADNVNHLWLQQDGVGDKFSLLPGHQISFMTHYFMIMNNELGRMWSDATVGYLNIW
jgi:hypothetical protein